MALIRKGIEPVAITELQQMMRKTAEEEGKNRKR